MADWLNIGSTHLYDLCGEEEGNELADVLDNIKLSWRHYAFHAHWFILDLGASYTLTKVKGRSNTVAYEPIDVDIFVSDDMKNWGTPVAEGISSWHDTFEWQEDDLIEKNGRYVKVVIYETENGIDKYLAWGFAVGGYKIFDLYGVAAPVANPYPTDRLKKNLVSGFHCFVNAHIHAEIGGFDPLKLPDGTIF